MMKTYTWNSFFFSFPDAPASVASKMLRGGGILTAAASALVAASVPAVACALTYAARLNRDDALSASTRKRKRNKISKETLEEMLQDPSLFLSLISQKKAVAMGETHVVASIQNFNYFFRIFYKQPNITHFLMKNSNLK